MSDCVKESILVVDRLHKASKQHIQYSTDRNALLTPREDSYHIRTLISSHTLLFSSFCETQNKAKKVSYSAKLQNEKNNNIIFNVF